MNVSNKYLLLFALLSSVVGFSQNRIKKTDYEYDLVSGNVKQITYQAGRPDTYVQQYKYDADNRITEVRSSSDGVIFNRDAAYTYYQHGPVARTVIGDNKVQGLDYTYTLQGWIKGVNSNVMDMVKDPGKDGQVAMKTARDVFSYSLGYYNNDYTSIGGSMQLLATIGTTNLNAANSGLFNGNIRHMITSLTDNNGVQMDGQGYRYQYDQLNRIKKSEMFVLNKSTNSFTTPVSNLYKETFGYDSNGNIASLTRNGNNSVSPGMDRLNYVYALEGGKKQNNRLLHVNDSVADGVYSTDIDDQKTFVANDPATWNYQYDGIGNLVKDKDEEIEEITWNVQGKIKTVHRLTGSTQPDLEFKYDALGHRIAKIEKPSTSLTTPSEWTYSYYALDANGKPLSIYIKKPENGQQRIRLKEQYVYGAKRLGSIQRDVDVTDPFLPMPSATPTFERVLGKKQYELTNHLNNVLEVISDKRNAHVTPGGTIDYYQAQVLTATDYYAFGNPMPGRDVVSENYRFGFNGMEKDNEIKGKGNSYDFGARIYDARLGRWLSLDPLANKYPGWSNYNFCLGNPILFIDPDGKDVKIDETLKTKLSEVVSVFYTLPIFNQIDMDDETFIRFGTDIEWNRKSSDTYGEYDGPPGMKNQHDPEIHLFHQMTMAGDVLIADPTSVVATLMHEHLHHAFEHQSDWKTDEHKDHNIMARADNRRKIEEGMRQFDARTNRYHDELYYEARAWHGLHKSKAWKDLQKTAHGQLLSRVLENEKSVDRFNKLNSLIEQGKASEKELESYQKDIELLNNSIDWDLYYDLRRPDGTSKK